MRKASTRLLLSVLIGAGIALQPAVCSAAAVIIMQAQKKHEQERQAELAQRKADAERMRAEQEAAEPKKNIQMEVGIKNAQGSISSTGPVASGSDLHLRLSEERQYIFSHTYGDDHSQVGKYTANLGQDIVLKPSITGGGQVLVEVSISYVRPDPKSEAPWLDRSFVTEHNNQTFLLENGAPAVTRTVKIPGIESDFVLSLKAITQAD